MLVRHDAMLQRAHKSWIVARKIAFALATAQRPLIVTSYVGRNVNAVDKLVELSEKLAIPVFISAPSTVNFPHNHPNFVDLSYGMGENALLSRPTCYNSNTRFLDFRLEGV